MIIQKILTVLLTFIGILLIIVGLLSTSYFVISLGLFWIVLTTVSIHTQGYALYRLYLHVALSVSISFALYLCLTDLI